eukprot:CAMPEP_0171796756 /NCGR_PEP_ID=MMETSP0991-20121206/69531_1 /TAXON_ID=483369 /ORGANISM="non described non described, Strain CCMP2098" /LENGTH=37 /DNA_ID= /DNA_START= /DNA_END= /DNA_ORIENTATION=
MQPPGDCNTLQIMKGAMAPVLERTFKQAERHVLPAVH